MYTVSDHPLPPAKCRQTINVSAGKQLIANKTCSAAIHRPWTHLMIAKQMQRASY